MRRTPEFEHYFQAIKEIASGKPVPDLPEHLVAWKNPWEYFETPQELEEWNRIICSAGLENMILEGGHELLDSQKGLLNKEVVDAFRRLAQLTLKEAIEKYSA